MGVRRTLVGGILLALPLGLAARAVTRAVPPSALAQGRWAILAVVLPGCSACDEASAGLARRSTETPKPASLSSPRGEARSSIPPPPATAFPSSWTRGACSGLPWASGGRRPWSSSSSAPLERLEGPFNRDEFLPALEKLAAAPREGPWGLLGKQVSLGRAQNLAGRDLDLGEVFQPLLLLFFNPRCPPCWEALPGLGVLGDEIAIVVVLVGAELLTEGERNRLEGTGLPVVRDAGELGRAFAVRATPTYVILDREGVIRGVHEGVADRKAPREAVLAAIGEAGANE